MTPDPVPHAEYARMKTHLYHRIDTLEARARAAEAALVTPADVQRRLALIESGGYSVTEMAHDLERLARHPVWAQAEARTVEAEREAERLGLVVTCSCGEELHPDEASRDAHGAPLCSGCAFEGLAPRKGRTDG